MAKSQVKGISGAVQKLMELNAVSEQQLSEIIGDSVFTAIMQDNYAYITIKDMQNLADAFGLIFVMNFQSLDQAIEDLGNSHD